VVIWELGTLVWCGWWVVSCSQVLIPLGRTQLGREGGGGAGNVGGVRKGGREEIERAYEVGGRSCMNGNGEEERKCCGVVVVEICGVAKQNQVQVRTDGDKKGRQKTVCDNY